MKKTLSFVAFLGLSLLGTTSLIASPLTPEEAFSRLQLSSGELPVATRAENMPEVKMTFKTINGQPALYVFQQKATPGFMLVSADDAVTPLLGYSETNSFDPDNIPPALQNWLEQYAEQIEYANSITPTLTRSSEITTRATLPSSWTPIEPLVKTVWNQNAPFYNNCPTYQGAKCYTGCVATSMAQVMKYFEYPAKAQGYIEYTPNSIKQRLTLDLSQITFDWANMINSYNDKYDPVQANAVAVLMQAAGYSVGMEYSPKSSGAVSGYIPGALVTYFNYDPSVMYVSRSMKDYTEFATLIYNNLKNVGPVIYDGDTDFSGGHSFICDGYQGNGYFHFNWGWGGTSDGYYLLDALNPSAIGIGGADGGFNFRQDIVINIQPLKADSQGPTDQLVLSGSLTGSLTNSNQYLNLVVTGNQYPGIRYYGLTEMTFNIGAKFEPTSGSGETIYANCGNNSVFQRYYMPLDSGHILYFDGSADYPFPMFVMAGLNLADNVKYKVTIACQPEGGNWMELPAGNGDYNYFYLTKSQNQYTIENTEQAQFDCQELELVSPLYEGQAANFDLKLINKDQMELTRGVTLFLLDEKGNTAFIGDSFVETIQPGQSFTTNWTTALTSQLTTKIMKPTPFYPALFDIDTQTTYYVADSPVMMQPNPGEPTYDVDLTLDNATFDSANDEYVYETSTKMTVTATINVKNGYFSYPISLYVMQDIVGTNNLEVLYSTQLPLTIIESGGVKKFTYTFNCPSLEVGKIYYMGIVVNNDNRLSIPEISFVVESNEAGVTTLTADANALRIIYDKNQKSVFATGDIAHIDVYSLSGVKLASTSDSSIDLSSFVNEVVIVTASDKKGNHTSAKLAL